MATASMQHLKQIDKYFQLIVFGYIRCIEKPLHFEIPPEISWICLLYYFSNDRFIIAHSTFNIKDDGKTILKNKMGYKSACGSIGIDAYSSMLNNMHYQWILKINKLARSCMVGITSNIDDIDQYSFHANDRGHSYAFDSFGTKFKNGIGAGDYGIIFYDGDIITMDLDLKKKHLRYSVNNKDQGVAFDVYCNKSIPEIKYYLAVSLLHKDDSVSIIRYLECKSSEDLQQHNNIENKNVVPKKRKKRNKGKCRAWNMRKGYGFIMMHDGDGRDIFVHYKDIYCIGFTLLHIGEEVEFDVMITNQGRLKAINVTGPNGMSVIGKLYNDSYYDNHTSL